MLADHAPENRCCQYQPEVPVMSLVPSVESSRLSAGCCLSFCIPVARSAPLTHKRLAFVQTNCIDVSKGRQSAGMIGAVFLDGS